MFDIYAKEKVLKAAWIKKLNDPCSIVNNIFVQYLEHSAITRSIF